MCNVCVLEKYTFYLYLWELMIKDNKRDTVAKDVFF